MPKCTQSTSLGEGCGRRVSAPIRKATGRGLAKREPEAGLAEAVRLAPAKTFFSGLDAFSGLAFAGLVAVSGAFSGAFSVAASAFALRNG